MPHAVSAHGACSRDEPGSEVVADEEDLAVEHRDPVHDEQRLLEAAVLVVAPVAEERLAQAVLVGDLEVAGRHDLVRVDVLGRERDDRAGEGLERFATIVSGHRPRPWPRSRAASAGRVTSPPDRRRGRGQRRGEERPAALALAALEVPVRGADRVLAGRQLVAVHRDAHRAAGLAPLGAGRPEDRVEPLALGLALHLVRAGHDHHPDAVGDLVALEDLGGEAEVADPAVRARADEHDVDLLAEDRLAGPQIHVLERPLERPLRGAVGLVVGRRHERRDRDAHAGVRAVGDHRLERRGVDRDRLVVRGAVVARQGSPALDGAVPGGALRRVRPAARRTRRSCRPGR